MTDIQKQLRSLYATANLLKHRFSVASLHAKCMLFNAYCTPMYGCQLWNTAYQYNRLQVAYNDAFTVLLNLPRWTSASSFFVLHHIAMFGAVIHKSVFSLYHASRNCGLNCSVRKPTVNAHRPLKKPPSQHTRPFRKPPLDAHGAPPVAPSCVARDDPAHFPA